MEERQDRSSLRLKLLYCLSRILLLIIAMKTFINSWLRAVTVLSMFHMVTH